MPDTPRAWGTVVLAWAAATLFIFTFYRVSHYTVLSEIRQHAKGVAISAASAVSAEDVRSIRSVADQDSEAYRRTQALLDRAVQFNPDIRYIYIMRRSTVPFSPSTAYEYVVDQPARDRNRDGVLGPDEQQEPPGKAYDATPFPALLEAWRQPSSDPALTADPPYPDLISGYAPVRNADQQTVAIVGVDITAETVQGKLRLMRWVAILIWLLVGSLCHLVVYLYYGQRESRDRARRRNVDLRARNELLRRVRQAPPDPPVQTPPQAQPVFDRYDLAVAAGGAGLCRLFEVDRDRLGLVLVDRRTDPLSAALATGLVDLLLERLAVAAGETVAGAFPYVDPNRPAEVLGVMGRLLSEELPEGGQVALLYGVIDFSTDRFAYADAGDWSVLQRANLTEVTVRSGPRHPALAPGWAVEPVESSQPVTSGDVLILANPGAGAEGSWPRTVQQALPGLTGGDSLALANRLAVVCPVAVLHIR